MSDSPLSIDRPRGAFDLVVVGGGLAGVVAALRATELGLRVIVLEQGVGDDYPCNTRQSGGIFHLAFHDPLREAAELERILRALPDNEAKPELIAALAENGARLISWLKAHGARFMQFNQREGYRWCLAPPRALRAGPDWKGRGPDVLLRDLVRQFIAKGGEVSLDSKARELVMQQERCVGVRGLREGQEAIWSAPCVLIADGGFQSNRQDYETHIGPNFDGVFQRGARTGVGDGMRMAKAVGAAVTAADRFYGHVLAAEARVNDRLWPYPEIDAIATAGIVVSDEGIRVVDEGRGGVYLANALARRPAGEENWAIFDAAIWEGPGRSARIPANPLFEAAGGSVLRADSIEELASTTGLPAATLRATLAGYNAAQERGTLSELLPARSTIIPAFPVRQAPFMAIKVMPGITYTMGGISIDGGARVLDESGMPIPGLYAAGAATGGIEGGSNATYVGGLMKSGVMGLLAAEHAAAELGGAIDPGAVPGSAGFVAETPQGLDRYPMLKLTARHGGTVAIALAALCAVAVFALSWSATGIWSAPIAAGAAAFVWIVVRSYVELVRLVTETLISG